MIKNIVFDLGNVITIYEFKEYVKDYVTEPADIKWIQNEVCNSVEWIQMDQGSITDEEAIASMCKRVPAYLHKTVARFVSEFRINQLPNPPMEALVARLKEAGYPLYLLSNTSSRFRTFYKNIKALEQFDHFFISCEHGVLKPELEIYHMFYREYNLEPETCFFIDDSPANVEAALRTGMQGCVYHKDVNALILKLQDAGIEV